MYRLKSILAFSVFLISFYLLASGHPVLSRPMFPVVPLPWGNWIAWVGFIAFPLSIYYGISSIRKPKSRMSGFFHILLKLNLFLAFLWIPITYGLSGNITNTFSEKASFQGGQLAMKMFWAFNGILLFLPIGILFAVGIQKILGFFSLKK